MEFGIMCLFSIILEMVALFNYAANDSSYKA